MSRYWRLAGTDPILYMESRSHKSLVAVFYPYFLPRNPLSETLRTSMLGDDSPEDKK